MKLRAAFLAAAIIAGPAWAADLYKWQDEQGITRYSDQLPPPGARNVQKFKNSSANLTEEKSAVQLPPASRAAAEKYPVTLYSADDCSPCKQAEDLLDKRGVPYTLKNDNDGMIELKKLTGKLDIPVMVIGNTTPISGFEEGRWNKELDLAGYAKSHPNAKPGTSMAIKPAPKATETPAATE